MFLCLFVLVVLSLSLSGQTYTPRHRPSSPQAAPSVDATSCYESRQVWVEGYWQRSPRGERYWVPGQWRQEQVAVPCHLISPPSSQYIPYGCTSPTLLGREYDRAILSISQTNFDHDKLIVAGQVIDHQCVSAEQVRHIMTLFAYEDTRLTFAKLAYEHTVDQHRYYVVNDVFRSGNSVRELQTFIGTNRSGYRR